MEFRRGKPELRQDRRICTRCSARTTRQSCGTCHRATKPRIQIAWFINGQRKRELTTYWKERDAQTVLQRKEDDYWRQQGLNRATEVGGTFEEAWQQLVQHVGSCSPDYSKQLRTALSAFGNGVGLSTPVQTISSAEIEQFRDEGLAVLSPATVRSYLLVLRRFFGWCQKKGRIRANPMDDVKLPRAQPRRGHLRPDEIAPVLEALRDEAPALAPIATLIVLGGWRKGEIVNLRRRDCDLQKRWAYVLNFDGDDLTKAWSPKTENSIRAVPLHPIVAGVLANVEVVHGPDGGLSPWVFPVLDRRKRRRYADAQGRVQPVRGDRRSPATSFLGRKLKEAVRAAGIQRQITVHDLRRTFAVLLQEAGAPDSVISTALGHAGKGVTQLHYLPRRRELVQKWVDRIDVPALALPPSFHQAVATQPPELDGRSAVMAAT